MKFSIIVPSYNREQQLLELLDAFKALNTNTPDFEIIIVDDGSQPPLSINKNAYDYPLTVLRLENSGPAKARNTGALSARGAYLVFTDDDCLPDPDWLMGFNEICDMDSRLLLGGRTVNGLEENSYSQATQLLADFLTEHYHPRDHPGGFFPSNNILVSRALFQDLNGFNSKLRYGEDRHFCYRWSFENRSFKSAPKAKIYHYHTLNFISFLKLHYNYGRGSLGFRQTVAREFARSVPISNWTFYLQLIFYPFKADSGLRATLFSTLLFCTQAANACGMISEWFKGVFLPTENVE